jgi:hypothetical protein
MPRIKDISIRLTKALTDMAKYQYHLDAATPDEIRFAVALVLRDMYRHFESNIPAGTAAPYRRD